MWTGEGQNGIMWSGKLRAETLDANRLIVKNSEWFTTGDLKFSLNTTQLGWVPLLGGTLGNEGSGADYAGEEYHALFDLLEALEGGTQVWANGDLHTLPNASNRFVKAVDPISILMGSETGNEGHVANLTDITQLPSLGGAPEVQYLKTPLTVSKSNFGTLGGGVSVVTNVTTGSDDGDGADIDVENAGIAATLLIKT